MKLAIRLFVAAAVLLLAACAATPQVAPDELTLRLPPASLGRELALQQRMTIVAMGRSQQMDVAIEVDSEAVRLAVLVLGQTVARLEWDGRALTESRASGWPAAVTGARVLSDLQLVHWPVEAIRAALPAGWSLQADGGGRVLLFRDAPVIRVRYPATASAELDNVAAGYRLVLEGWPAR